VLPLRTLTCSPLNITSHPSQKKDLFRQAVGSKEDEWKNYLIAVLRYCMEGNVEADWTLQKKRPRFSLQRKGSSSQFLPGSPYPRNA
jgi:hypothetical protein